MSRKPDGHRANDRRGRDAAHRRDGQRADRQTGRATGQGRGTSGEVQGRTRGQAETPRTWTARGARLRPGADGWPTERTTGRTFAGDRDESPRGAARPAARYLRTRRTVAHLHGLPFRRSARTSRSMSRKPDGARDARHGAQGRGARPGRATSRTERGNATGGITARIAANVDGEGRTVAARSGNGTGKRTTGGTFDRNRARLRTFEGDRRGRSPEIVTNCPGAQHVRRRGCPDAIGADVHAR